MEVPLAVAAPAAAASLAYLNARSALWWDVHLLKCVVPFVVPMYWRAYTGRLNHFYDLEYYATQKSSANRPFLLFEGKSFSYAVTYDWVLRYGQWLKKKFGVKRGDTVAMDFPNSEIYVFIWLGLWSIGARPAFINYNLTGQALAHSVKVAKTNIMLVDPAVAHQIDDQVRKELPSVKFHVFTEACAAEVSATEPIREPDEVRRETELNSMAILIYTSGTTGLPKAAVVSWGKCQAAGGVSARLVGSKPGEVYYTCMPLYHSSATLMAFTNVLLMGATLALGNKFSTKTFWKDVRRYDATIIQYVGETCRYLLAAPPEIDPVTGEDLDKKHRVRIAYGNGLRPDVWNRFKDRFGIPYIGEFYASTEGNFATFNISRNDFSMGAVGRSGWLYGLVIGHNNGLVRIDWDSGMPYRDPKTGLCKRAKAGEPGEYLFRLPNDVQKRFQGYYGNNKATSEKVIRNVFRQGDAWFRTGDVLRQDAEGRMYFNDRLGDTFRWKSENVSTAEVSQVLGLHTAIKEANVYGVQLPNHDGRAGCAAIVLDGEPSAETLKSLAEHVLKELPRYAVPLFLRVTKEGIQATGTNKHQKHDLRQEGVNPDKMRGDEMLWLRDGTYVKFTKADWQELNGGRVKL